MLTELPTPPQQLTNPQFDQILEKLDMMQESIDELTQTVEQLSTDVRMTTFIGSE